MVQVKIINQSPFDLPAYQTMGSAGMDIRAHIDTPVVLQSLERRLIPSGLYIELPPGYEAQIRPRSGLAYKNGITVLNSPGTVDSDYRGEIKVLLVNLSKEDFVIQAGERIAQMVISRHEQVTWELSTQLADSERGTGGYGSTGKI